MQATRREKSVYTARNSFSPVTSFNLYFYHHRRRRAPVRRFVLCSGPLVHGPPPTAGRIERLTRIICPRRRRVARRQRRMKAANEPPPRPITVNVLIPSCEQPSKWRPFVDIANATSHPGTPIDTLSSRLSRHAMTSSPSGNALLLKRQLTELRKRASAAVEAFIAPTTVLTDTLLRPSSPQAPSKDSRQVSRMRATCTT